MFAALEAAGARFDHAGTPAGWPVEIQGVAAPPRVELLAPASGSEVSALLIALAAGEDDRRLVVAGDYPGAR